MSLKVNIVAAYFLISVNAFLVRISQDIVSVEESEDIQLSCKSDTAYEFCKFVSPSGDGCQFEWKRAKWNITMQGCQELKDRVSFTGSYDDNECGITVTSARVGDTGRWQCHLESYVLGHTRGALRIGEIDQEKM